MISLIRFRPSLGLPDPSPFVIKAMVLLKLAGQPYQDKIVANPGRGPKGKLPAFRDGAETIGDSHGRHPRRGRLAWRQGVLHGR